MPLRDACTVIVRGTIAVCCVFGALAQGHAQGPTSRHPSLVTIAPPDEAALAEADARVTRMIRRGLLKLREQQADKLVAGRTQEWFTQLHKGVPVAGTEVWRQRDQGRVSSIGGTLYDPITLDPVPKLTSLEAIDLLRKLDGGGPGPSLPPTLLVLPRDDGTFALVYRARLFGASGLRTVTLDANTGQEIESSIEPGAPPAGRR
jgi:Fungalysin/Thermolysin Propeptide Motif